MFTSCQEDKCSFLTFADFHVSASREKNQEQKIKIDLEETREKYNELKDKNKELEDKNTQLTMVRSSRRTT